MRKHKLAWTSSDNTCTFSEPIQANANVLIPKGTHVLLKESPPPLGTVVVEGVLEVDPTAEHIKMMVRFRFQALFQPLTQPSVPYA